MLHIWHEDSFPDKSIPSSKKSSTQQFWEFLQNNKVDNKLIGADIRGFNGYSNLHDYVIGHSFSKNDKYIIFMDYVLDNSVAIKYYQQVYNYVKPYKNVYLSDLLCFEYLMLCFKYLDVWLRPKNGCAQYAKRISVAKEFINYQTQGIPWIKSNLICNYLLHVCKKTNIAQLSSEDVATLLLNNITHHSHFEINKTYLSPCWTNNCCVKNSGMYTCSLYKYKKNKVTKANNLWNCTIAKRIIRKYG